MYSDAGQLIIVDNSTETDGIRVQVTGMTLAGSRLRDILTGECYPVTVQDGTVAVQLPVQAGCIEAYRVE